MYQSALSAAETAEALYIKDNGEMMAETVILSWLDSTGLDKNVELRTALKLALESTLSEREIAELASRCVGGPGFESWLGDQL